MAKQISSEAARNITARAMIAAVDAPKKLFTGYNAIFHDATNCTIDECPLIYTAIVTVGGFTALDHLSRSDLLKMARRVYPIVKSNPEYFR
jgi:hypothetical protein